MDHQKPTILLIFGTLSLGGCGGHPMRPKLNLKDKSQMSTPNEYTGNFKSNSTCIFLSVRTKSKKKTLCPRTQCIEIQIQIRFHIDYSPIVLSPFLLPAGVLCLINFQLFGPKNY